MKIAFRVDASEHIGSGHVMRCLALADGLAGNGVDCLFLCGDLPGNLNKLIHDRGFEVKILKLNSSNYSLAGQAFSVLTDDATTADFTQSKKFLVDVNVVIVDHYLIDARWESKARLFTNGLVIVDDIANRPHDCDILIDQNYDDMQRYLPLVPEHCQLLLGPKYALLRPEYAAYKTQRRFLSTYDQIKKIFIFFGGADKYDLTGKALTALSHCSLVDIHVDIVVGASYLYLAELEYNAKLRGNTAIHTPRLHLADLMSEADLAIGAGGVTNWERLTLGLPSLIITLADNQKPISQLLDAQGVIKLLGAADKVSPHLILSFLSDHALINRLLQNSPNAMMLCDGLGTQRVVDTIQSLSVN
jgi:UDP-2,4-diacetamido-2,4,6-trideoxy-beta-L-altropyranose hydrolase